VLFGDGAAAVVLESSDREEGVLAKKLGCDGDGARSCAVQGMGGAMPTARALLDHPLQFEGQEISSAPCRA